MAVASATGHLKLTLNTNEILNLAAPLITADFSQWSAKIRTQYPPYQVKCNYQQRWYSSAGQNIDFIDTILSLISSTNPGRLWAGTHRRGKAICPSAGFYGFNHSVIFHPHYRIVSRYERQAVSLSLFVFPNNTLNTKHRQLYLRIVICFIYGISPYLAVNTSYHSYKSQSVNDV